MVMLGKVEIVVEGHLREIGSVAMSEWMAQRRSSLLSLELVKMYSLCLCYLVAYYSMPVV